MRRRRAVPRAHLRVERTLLAISMARPARAYYSLGCIERGAWDGDRVVGAFITNRVTDLGLLQVRHVATRAATPRTGRCVLRVQRRILGLARVARRALPVVEAIRERS